MQVLVVDNVKKLERRVEPTKKYTKSQNKYAPETKQLKSKVLSTLMNRLIIGVASKI